MYDEVDLEKPQETPVSEGDNQGLVENNALKYQHFEDAQDGGITDGREIEIRTEESP